MTAYGPNPDVAALAEKAFSCFLNEEPTAAMDVVEDALEHYDHVRLWRIKARLLVLGEREEEAATILNRVLIGAWKIGFWELALSRLPYSYALLADDAKIAYFPVRKCSSTTLHNAMALLGGKVQAGEDIHGDVDQYDLIAHEDWPEKMSAYYKVLLIRSPIERVRSFYYGNIQRRHHLVDDTGGRDSFYGLATKPSYEEFLDNFSAYRRTFITVRNHTDPLVGYVGNNTGMFDWIGGVGQTNALLEQMSEISGVSLPQIHDMQTGKGFPISKSGERNLEDFYAEDFGVYGAYF